MSDIDTPVGPITWSQPWRFVPSQAFYDDDHVIYVNYDGYYPHTSTDRVELKDGKPDYTTRQRIWPKPTDAL